jgi:FkbM family methyltransferase
MLQKINIINQEAAQRRVAMRSQNSELLMRATLKELLKLPPYIGFVEGGFLSDLSFVMFLCDRDDGVALRLFWKGEFERVSLAIWRRLVLTSDLVVDVGGHTGIYSIVAGLTNPKAQVHTFEPHEMNFGRLLLNLRANGLRAHNAHNLAASAAAGSVPFRVKINHYLSSGGAVAEEGGEFTKMVSAAPIDDHVPLNARKVCVKIDTEGHEVEVLAGMPKLLELRPDVILECAFVPAMLNTELDLKARQYRFFHIDEQGWKLSMIDSLSAPPFDVVGTSRENVLLTTRTEGEVRALFDLARGDYRPA